MKTICLILLSLALVYAETNDITLEKGVLVLNKDNFQKARDESKFLLVEFYAPWCGHCQRLEPEYAQAAQTLAESDPEIKLAKCDATENEELADKFNVGGFPTIKFFTQGEEEPQEFMGGRTANEIVMWLKKRSGQLTVQANSVEEVEKYATSSEAIALFIGSAESKHYNDYAAVSKDNDELAFLHSNSDDVKTKYGAEENQVVVINGNGKEHHVYTGDASTENYKKYIEENQYPAVSDFNQGAVGRIFQAGKEAIILLIAKNEAGEQAEATFRKAAEELKGEIIFTVARFEEDLGGRVAEFLGIPEDELPTVRIVQPANDMKKYKPEGDISVDNIKNFINEFKAGNLKPFFKSAVIPDEPYDGNVRVIVAKTWEEIVLDKTKDVLVEFYAPWCGHCKNLAPIYEELAAKYRSVESLVIAKMEATANEVEGVYIEGFPTIRLYKKDDKENPIEFDRDRDEKHMVRFLKRHGALEADAEDDTDYGTYNGEDAFGDYNGENAVGDEADGHDHAHDHAHDHDHDHAHDHDHKADDEL